MTTIWKKDSKNDPAERKGDRDVGKKEDGQNGCRCKRMRGRREKRKQQKATAMDAKRQEWEGRI